MYKVHETGDGVIYEAYNFVLPGFERFFVWLDAIEYYNFSPFSPYTFPGRKFSKVLITGDGRVMAYY